MNLLEQLKKFLTFSSSAPLEQNSTVTQGADQWTTSTTTSQPVAYSLPPAEAEAALDAKLLQHSEAFQKEFDSIPGLRDALTLMAKRNPVPPLGSTQWTKYLNERTSTTSAIGNPPDKSTVRRP